MADLPSKSKGLLWTDTEIETMLQELFNLKAGRRVMTSTNVETTKLFQEVSEKLAGKGYVRSFSQIRAKFKKEKALFYDSMEDHGGLPPRELWGPRFHLLNQLWEQGDKPDYRQRRPATSGKAKKRNLETPSHTSGEEASSTLPEERSPTPATDRDYPNVPTFLVEGRKPTFDELVTEVLNLREEMSRVKRSNKFLRQGIIRLRNERERKHMLEAIEMQRQESSTSDDSEEEDDNDNSTEVEQPVEVIALDESEERGDAEVVDCASDSAKLAIKIPDPNKAIQVAIPDLVDPGSVSDVNAAKRQCQSEDCPRAPPESGVADEEDD